MAGLRAGDVLFSWSADGSSSHGTIDTPFDLSELEVDVLPFGPLTLRGQREGNALEAHLPPEGYGLYVKARPVLPGALLAHYESGRALIADGKFEEASFPWAEAITQAPRPDIACWLQATFARLAGEAKRTEISRARYREAIDCAQRLGPRQRTRVLAEQGIVESALGQSDQAEAAFAAAYETLRLSGARGAVQGLFLATLADVTARREPEKAKGLLWEALGLVERDAPASLAASSVRNILGWRLAQQGELDEADEHYMRSEANARAMHAEGPTMIAAVTGQVITATLRGDLAAAERHSQRSLRIRQALTPDGLDDAVDQLNAGAIAAERGDITAAEERYHYALSLADKEQSPRAPRLRAYAQYSLGELARARGDLDAAADFMRRSVDAYDALAPDETMLVGMLSGLAETLRLKGDTAGAKALLVRALALCESHAPASLSMASVLLILGDIARESGDWTAAEGRYARALAIRERLAPASASLAQALHGLGSLWRARGDLDQASSFFMRAIETLEAQREKVTASDETRSLFSSHFYGMYQDELALQVKRGKTRDAFDLLERGRARSLLTLMAERDLIIEGEIPSELERQRRRVDAQYEQALTELGGLNAEQDLDAIGRRMVRLRDIGDLQTAIAEKIQKASPRLADLRRPQPLDFDAVSAGLDPGTVLVSYSVGKDETLVFAVRRGRSLEVASIPIGGKELRARVERWRGLLEQTAPPPEFFSEASGLYALLLKPVEQHLRTAQRILVSPDGPLHKVPFGALRRGNAYVVEWKPLHLVQSGTIYARLVATRGPIGARASLVAFGDPRYRTPGPARLVHSRDEVREIVSLFPDGVAHLDTNANEERAKTIGKGVRFVHFACHALINERFPLDSALLLSAPSSAGEAAENGTLYAWEIMERLRLDADLVTLSACHSATGAPLAGEGLIGLTRAFQYAGARSVLASLWSVGDKSTLRLMTQFYGLLKQGVSKDEALRQAQIASIRAGRHPVRWAAFQLHGDWR
jgi:CHAT domain-containing protein